MFFYFISVKNCASPSMPRTAIILPIMAVQKRSGAAPSKPNTGPTQVPYSRVLGPRTPATRRNHQQTRNNAASIDMAIVMRIIGKFDRKILVAFHPSIMATERSKGAPGGRFMRPKPLPRPPKSNTVRIYMYIKTW